MQLIQVIEVEKGCGFLLKLRDKQMENKKEFTVKKKKTKGIFCQGGCNLMPIKRSKRKFKITQYFVFNIQK